MSDRSSIPRPTVKRLSLYLRELMGLDVSRTTTVSSRQLGDLLGLTDAQVRKDLACFGQFGHPGIGYRVDVLIQHLRKILGTDRQWAVAVVGAGNIGRAIAAYDQFTPNGFEVCALFDNDPGVIGTQAANHAVRPMGDMARIVAERDIRIGIIAVPAKAAQTVADALIDAGVRGILSFAPVRLDVHDAVVVLNVDFSRSLEQLAFQVSLGLTGSLGAPDQGA